MGDLLTLQNQGVNKIHMSFGVIPEVAGRRGFKDEEKNSLNNEKLLDNSLFSDTVAPS